MPQDDKSKQTDSTVVGFNQLALQYYPTKNKKAASRSLSRIINGDQDLLDELADAGYASGQRTFTPRQAKIIRKYME